MQRLWIGFVIRLYFEVLVPFYFFISRMKFWVKKGIVNQGVTKMKTMSINLIVTHDKTFYFWCYECKNNL